MEVLVSDYDGTFYTNEKDIYINCKKVKEFIENGNIFVLSSGRSYESLIKKVNEYNIPYNYLACADGSFLFDSEKRMHYAYTMSHDVIKIVDELKKCNNYKKIEYTNPLSYNTEYDEEKILGSVTLTIDKENINNMFIDKINSIKEKYPEYQYDIYGYDNTYFYLIRPNGVSKSSPIRYLEERHNLDRNNIYTIGDNTNDFELIRDYNGYRIGNNKDIIDVSLKEYNAVYELVDDINKKKVLKRW